ncbi:MAG: TIGR02281 family clan AA aspartic protease [Rhodospirillaceae bacterium]|nr:TIGR02281 family clan AA aspartic protease [Rhodospirillaceae bacterium]
MRSRRFLILLAGAIAAGAVIAWLVGRYPQTLDDRGNVVQIVVLLGWLLLVGGALWGFVRAQPGTALRNMFIWIAIGLVLVMGYTLKDQITGAVMPSAGTSGADGSIEFQRANDGHFRVDTEVEGVLIRFLVDTGASEVVLSQADAERLGFDIEALEYTQRYNTANGIVWGAPVRLREIRLGDIVVEDVRASVNSGEMDGSLLGMSFLSKLSGFSVEGDRLILNP